MITLKLHLKLEQININLELMKFPFNLQRNLWDMVWWHQFMHLSSRQY